MTDDLKRYIQLVESEEALGLLHEMANVGPRRHGIENVYIYVGSVQNSGHWIRVKVSNVPGKYDRNDNFVIKMPDLDYDPTQVADWLKPKINDILDWIKLNQKLLHDYETGVITDTDEFLDNISKV
jgi:hypothetical protein